MNPDCLLRFATVQSRTTKRMRGARRLLECGDLSPLFLVAWRQEALGKAGRFWKSGDKSPHSKRFAPSNLADQFTR